MSKSKTRTHTTKSGDTFEWEETEQARKAIAKLHGKTFTELELKAPDYGVGK